ncbi:hypothetical protein FHX81_0121 [Saccharothrix saharensis]|uniref:Uncharacterized protein n=1 Tax=Saccharothrix saharensis TaxID=571190 RepID=A0A543J4X5_9PSEU|nr:hypothetical protein [Saccharothrix saharensis]TQM77876.1 hypothetical protein FHX81_0121 [Saccharothrix saharensis]
MKRVALVAVLLGGLVVTTAPAAAADSAPVGFAAVNAPGRNGTTGGADGPEVTVSTAADLIAAIKATGNDCFLDDSDTGPACRAR